VSGRGRTSDRLPNRLPTANQPTNRQLSNPAMLESCPLPFDEGRLWKGQHGASLKSQLQAAFQNITRVMDCVGCEKCKLWGKLQTLGGWGWGGRGKLWRSCGVWGGLGGCNNVGALA
jgi:hypothetical protein